MKQRNTPFFKSHDAGLTNPHLTNSFARSIPVIDQRSASDRPDAGAIRRFDDAVKELKKTAAGSTLVELFDGMNLDLRLVVDFDRPNDAGDEYLRYRIIGGDTTNIFRPGETVVETDPILFTMGPEKAPFLGPGDYIPIATDLLSAALTKIRCLQYSRGLKSDMRSHLAICRLGGATRHVQFAKIMLEMEAAGNITNRNWDMLHLTTLRTSNRRRNSLKKSCRRIDSDCVGVKPLIADLTRDSNFRDQVDVPSLVMFDRLNKNDIELTATHETTTALENFSPALLIQAISGLDLIEHNDQPLPIAVHKRTNNKRAWVRASQPFNSMGDFLNSEYAELDTLPSEGVLYQVATVLNENGMLRTLFGMMGAYDLGAGPELDFRQQALEEGFCNPIRTLGYDAPDERYSSSYMSAVSHQSHLRL